MRDRIIKTNLTEIN